MALTAAADQSAIGTEPSDTKATIPERSAVSGAPPRRHCLAVKWY